MEETGRQGREVREGGSHRAAARAKGWQRQQGATVSSNGCRRPEWQRDAMAPRPLKTKGGSHEQHVQRPEEAACLGLRQGGGASDAKLKKALGFALGVST